MEGKNLKRMRSEDDESNNNITQTKVWVNEKINDSRDPEKMKALHEKTTKMLFQAAANIEATNTQSTQDGVGITINLAAPAAAAAAAAEEADSNLYQQYQLLGDGNIILRDMRPDAANPQLVRRISKCCHRPTFIRGKCINCTFDLCEECGYSCVECEQFICRSCVTLFGNRPEESERPLCEICEMFVS